MARCTVRAVCGDILPPSVRLPRGMQVASRDDGELAAVPELFEATCFVGTE